MHELAVSNSICTEVRAHLAPGQRPRRIVVECGPFSGVVPGNLEYCFPIAASLSGLDGAKLEIRSLRAEATCPACAASFSVGSMWELCPECQFGPVTARGGRELRLVELEVEEDGDVSDA